MRWLMTVSASNNFLHALTHECECIEWSAIDSRIDKYFIMQRTMKNIQ